MQILYNQGIIVSIILKISMNILYYAFLGQEAAIEIDRKRLNKGGDYYVEYYKQALGNPMIQRR